MQRFEDWDQVLAEIRGFGKAREASSDEVLRACALAEETRKAGLPPPTAVYVTAAGDIQIVR